MSEDSDFASFMAGQTGPVVADLAVGKRVSGRVTQIAGDSIFVDLGTRAEGRIPRAQVELRDGTVPLKVGDTIEATVVDTGGGGGPMLAVKLGKDQRVDLGALEMAMESQTPVAGTVSRAVKGGLELDLHGARAFCPASQVDRSYVSDLTGYVGQELSVLVTEIKEDGRSVVVSRRKALETEQAQAAAQARERLSVGMDIEGTVASLQKYGAFVDVGGVEGLVHISELSPSHVERVEDIVKAGESVRVRVLSIEDGDKGPRIRLSMKALSQPAAGEGPGKDEVLSGKVTRFLPHGLIVQTDKGEGFVPKRELPLAPGADHRRAFAVDQELDVVVLDGAAGRTRFSALRVDEVRAGQNFREYQKAAAPAAAAGLGSLGALLSGIDRGALPKGAPAPEPKPRADKPAAAPKRRDARPQAGGGGTQASPGGARTEPSAAPAPATRQATPANATPANAAPASAAPEAASVPRKTPAPPIGRAGTWRSGAAEEGAAPSTAETARDDSADTSPRRRRIVHGRG